MINQTYAVEKAELQDYQGWLQRADERSVENMFDYKHSSKSQ